MADHENGREIEGLFSGGDEVQQGEAVGAPVIVVFTQRDVGKSWETWIGFKERSGNRHGHAYFIPAPEKVKDPIVTHR